MPGEIEATADAVTGVLVAHAVDPSDRVHADGHTHEAACLNCGTRLVGEHCHACGQTAHLHRSLGALVHDIAHGVFHFEGKIWSTLPLLARFPGELTRRYIHGERVRFVSPMALFLFSVFLMVAAFSWLGGPIRSERIASHSKVDSTADIGTARTALDNEATAAAAKVKKLEAKRAARVTAGRNTEEIDEMLSEAREEFASAQLAQNVTDNIESRADEPAVDKAEIAKAAAAKADTVDTGVNLINKGISHIAKNPELMAYKLQSSAYKFSWALIPISLPFIWLMFVFRRDVTFYDHAIFATYSISAMTLLVTTLSVLAIFLHTAFIALALVLLPPWHMYRQLRGAYQIGHAAALWRTGFLLLSATLAGGLFFALLVGMQMGH
jgi:hypothetical protein